MEYARIVETSVQKKNVSRTWFGSGSVASDFNLGFDFDKMR
jgi:hypothetical protein